MITVSNLKYIYNPNTHYEQIALKDISFNIAAGEIIGIIGPTGSGKSCLLRCLAGVLKPTRGEITYQNKSIKVGLVIQEPEQQFFLESVNDEISLAFKFNTKESSEVKKSVQNLADIVGYEGPLNQSPFRLSGGEQRRVAIASILAMQPQILLLDEPTVGMDGTGIDSIRSIISNYRKEKGIVIVVSHDMDFLYSVVDRFIALNNGRLIADFKIENFINNVSSLEEAGIGIPEKVRLLKRDLPKLIMQTLQEREWID